MTKFQLTREIEKLAKELCYDAWGFYRCYLTMAYDNFKKSELEEMLEDLKKEQFEREVKKHGQPF